MLTEQAKTKVRRSLVDVPESMLIAYLLGQSMTLRALIRRKELAYSSLGMILRLNFWHGCQPRCHLILRDHKTRYPAKPKFVCSLEILN